jgi:4-amino-4-deoxy-L-arabinose transferase-like glycosyltransferase
MMVGIGIFAGYLVYLIAAQFYGKRGGLFALFLFCFTPEILAHSSLATTDITAMCFMLLALFSFWKFMQSPTKIRFFLAGISLGLAQLSKYSAVILYPIFIFLLITEFIITKNINWKSFKALILIFLISIVTIWAGYGFKTKPFLTETMNQQEKIDFVKNSAGHFLPFWNKNLSDKTTKLLSNTPLPLTTYISGFLGVMKHTSAGHNTFFMGKWSDYGSYWYYLLAFFIKTPVTIIILFFTAILSLFWIRLKKDEYYLLIPIVFIFLIASVNKLQLGIRYILLIYPLCFIFSSRFIPFVRHIWQKSAVVILMLWLVIANIFIWPHYLSYFNEFIGGANNGWKYLRDSNLDWGQDLPALAKYMKENAVGEITLLYFGEDNPVIYGINFIKITKEELIKPEKKAYAISVQYLDSVHWAKDLKPTAKAGYSIFIYDLRNSP